MSRRKLSVVPPDALPPVKPKSLKAAVELSERVLLVAMRERLAAEIDAGPPAHAVRGLMSELRTVDKEIRLLDARVAESDDGGCAEDEAWDSSVI